MFDITPAIRGLAPHANATAWATALTSVMASGGLTTPKRAAAFLGQCSVETGGFERWVEDTWYVTAARIAAVFPSYFPNAAAAAPFCGAPEHLANHVYAGRNGNDDEASGDGWRFRGRGLIQITGRSQYQQFATALHKPLDDAFLTWMETPAGAAQSAVWWWTAGYGGSKHVLVLSDGWLIRDISQVVHGSLSDLHDRLQASNLALAYLAEPKPATAAR